MAVLNIESILQDIESLIEEQQTGSLLNIMVDLHPADIEAILNRLKKDERIYLFNLLPSDLASEVLPELDAPVAEDVIEDADTTRLSSIVHEMDSDDAADFIADLPDERKEEVLESLEQAVSEDVKELLLHDEDTAGGIMALEVVAMPESATVNETIDKIREEQDNVDHLYNIWVTDHKERYLGSVSLTDLVLAHGNTTLNAIMDSDIRAVDAGMDQEEVAHFFRKYDLVSAPVIDKEGLLIGRITVDDVVDILDEERSEDIAHLAGAPDEEILESSALVISRARIPWLLVAFIGELVAAFILNSFNLPIETQLVFAIFIPVIMAMGGASGQQASVTVVRGLAIGDIKLQDTRKRLFKEFRISLVSSTFFALILFSVVYYWQGLLFATILGTSMFIVINNATILGAMVPLMFKRLNIDPALAAAPLVSTSNDIIGLVIYLSITTLFLSFGL